MPVLSRPDMRRILSHPGNPIRTAIVHTPPKIPRRSRDRRGRSGPRGLATVRWQTRLTRRGKRKDTAGNLCAPPTCRAIQAAICQQASWPRSTCALPRRYLPSTFRRPATPPGAGQPQRPRRRIRFCLMWRRSWGAKARPGIDAEVTLAVMPMLRGVLCDGRRGALDGCVPGPEVSNEGSKFGGTFQRGEGA